MTPAPVLPWPSYFFDLASLLGVAFVVGGLVVTAASIVTLVSVRRQAQAVAREEVAKARQEFDRNMGELLQGYSMYLQIRLAPPDVVDVHNEDVVLPALAPIKGATYHVATRLHEVARTCFLRTLFRPVDVWQAESPQTLAHRAIVWLDAALSLQDGPAVTVHAMLAECYGILGDQTRTIAHSKQLQAKEHSLTLSIPCLANPYKDGIEHKISALGQALRVDMPWSPERIQAELDAADARGEGPAPAWEAWTIPIPYFWQGQRDWAPDSPCRLQLYARRGEMRAQWYVGRQRANSGWPDGADTWAAVADVVKAIAERFWVVGTPSEPTRYREDWLPERVYEWHAY